MHWNGSRWYLIFVETLGVDVFQYADWLMLKLSSQIQRLYWWVNRVCFIGVGGWGSKTNLSLYIRRARTINGLVDILRVSLCWLAWSLENELITLLLSPSISSHKIRNFSRERFFIRGFQSVPPLQEVWGKQVFTSLHALHITQPHLYARNNQYFVWPPAAGNK